MNNRPILTFLVFVVISAAAWLVVKLSENYTTQAQFRLRIEEVPADRWLSSPEQNVNFSMTTNGFHTLRYKMMREQKRVVGLSLTEVPYRFENGTTYSFSSSYVAEQVAEMLGVNVNDLTMNDSKVFVNMDPLMSKLLPVTLRSDIRPQRQFEVYGIPVLDPASVTVYGPEATIDTLKSVSTQWLTKANVNAGFTETVALDLLDGQIRSEVKTVRATVQVEKFTETDIQVPLTHPDSLHVRFFPDAVTVKCHVSLKDYTGLTPDMFRVEVDKGQLEALQPLLGLSLTAWPPYVQVLNITPEKVEYLIVQ